jgi:hypothetical protein
MVIRPVPIFSDVRFSYLAQVQDKKIMCVLPANACEPRQPTIEILPSGVLQYVTHDESFCWIPLHEADECNYQL